MKCLLGSWLCLAHMAAGLAGTDRYTSCKQVQSKLAFQPVRKDEQAPEAAEAARVTGAANHPARSAYVERNRRAAPALAQLLRQAKPCLATPTCS